MGGIVEKLWMRKSHGVDEGAAQKQSQESGGYDLGPSGGHRMRIAEELSLRHHVFLPPPHRRPQGLLRQRQVSWLTDLGWHRLPDPKDQWLMAPATRLQLRGQLRISGPAHKSISGRIPFSPSE
jgi:hypothetical protein